MSKCHICGSDLDYIESSRVMIKHDPLKEGIIELRKGVDDISLGEKRYAQVRIRVGDAGNYIKGMAVNSDEIPYGYDVVFYIGNEFDEHGRVRGCGTDAERKYTKPLTIIESDRQKVLEAWKAKVEEEWTKLIKEGEAYEEGTEHR